MAMRFDKIGVDAWQRLGAAAGGAIRQGMMSRDLAEVDSAKLEDQAPVEDVTPVDAGLIRAKAQGDAAGSDGPGLTPPPQVGSDQPAASVAPEPPKAIEPERVQVSPKQYKFMGKTYDKPLTDQEMESAREMARVDVITKYDPEKGLGLRRQMKLDARDAESHGLKVEELKAAQQRREQLDRVRPLAAEYSNANPARQKEIIGELAKIDGGMELLVGAETYQKAMRGVANRAVMDAYQKSGIPGVINAYNQHYNDGNTAFMVPGKNQVVIKNKDGEQVGAWSWKDQDDFLYQLGAILDPKVAADRYEARLAAQSKLDSQIALERAKAEGRSVRGGNWIQTESGDWMQLPGGGKGGGSGSAAGDGESGVGLPKDWMEAIRMIKNDAMDPSTFGKIPGYAESIQSLSGRLGAPISPQTGVAAAVMMAEGAKPVMATDPQTGARYPVVKLPSGQVVVVGKPVAPAPSQSPSAAPAAAAQAQQPAKQAVQPISQAPQRSSPPSPAADPLANKSRSQIREIRSALEAERARYTSSNAKGESAAARIKEIDGLLDRINSGRY